MRRCLGFGFKNRSSPGTRTRIPSRAAVSSEANGKIAALVEETREEEEGEHPIPSSSSSAGHSSATTQRLSSRGYQEIINSPSFKQIQEKINPVNGGEPSIREVLRPDPASVEAALSQVKPTSLNRLVSEYFTHSEQACRLCLVLQGSIRKARHVYRCLRVALDAPAPSAEDGSSRSRTWLSQAQCESIFDVFQKFVQCDDAFDPNQTGIDNLNELNRQFRRLDNQLKCLRKKAAAEDRRLRQTTRGSALCLVVATVALVAAGLAIAAHATVTLLASSPALLLPCCFLGDDKDCDPLGPRRRRVNERVTLAGSAERGTIVFRHLEDIEMLVKKLHITRESVMSRAGFVLQNPRGDRDALELVIDVLRNEQDRFFEDLNELENYICICCNVANQSRERLYDHICCTSSLGSRLQGEMRDDDAGDSSELGANNMTSIHE